MVSLQEACDYLSQALAKYGTARSISAIETAILAMHTGLETAFRAYLVENDHLPTDIREAVETPGVVRFPNLVDLMGDYTDVLGPDPSTRALLVSLNTTRAQIAHPLDKPSQEQIVNDAYRFAEMIIALWPRLFVGRRVPSVTPVTMGMLRRDIPRTSLKVEPSAAQPFIPPVAKERQQPAPTRRVLLESLWRGETKPYRWLRRLVGGLVVAVLANLSWKAAVASARWPPPVKSASVVLVIVALGLVAWGGWLLWHAFRLLGLRRILGLLCILYLSVVSVRVLTPGGEQPLVKKTLLQTQGIASEAWGMLVGFTRSLIEAPATFRFAYTGRNPLIEVPGVEVNPTPIEGEIIEPLVYTTLDELKPTETPAPAHTPVPPRPEASEGMQVGGYVEVHSTGGKTLRARSGPGTSYDVVTRFGEGTRLLLLEGPVEADGYVWWKVGGDQDEGWCAGQWLAPTD